MFEDYEIEIDDNAIRITIYDIVIFIIKTNHTLLSVADVRNLFIRLPRWGKVARSDA